MVVDAQVSMLLKGTFGFGKTLAAATFAAEGPVYLAYWDKKKPLELEHFFRKIIKRPELLRNITYEIYGAHNANEFLNKLITFQKSFPYFAFINDSVTNMTAGAVNWSLGFRPSKNTGKDKIMPDFDEYKVETSLVSQCLDLSRSLPAHNIWIAHPVPSVKIEGSGSSIKVTKVNPIVTYGSKVAGILPGQFSEIYHFSKLNNWDASTGKATTKYVVDTEAVGDDYAKSNIGLKAQMDITGVLFYEVWKEEVRKLKEEINDLKKIEESKPIPFTNIISYTANKANTPIQPEKKWNPQTGSYE